MHFLRVTLTPLLLLNRTEPKGIVPTKPYYPFSIMKKYLEFHSALVSLPPEGAPLTESGQTTGRLAQHDVTRRTQHDGLSVAVDGGDLKAARTLHVHEEASEDSSCENQP